MNKRAYLVALGVFLSAVAACGGSSTDDRSADAQLPEQAVVPTPGATPGAVADGKEVYVLPTWTREDVQPKSPRKGQTYGLESFRGKTIVVTLFEGFCTFCRSNSLLAEQLQNELTQEGYDVVSVILGDPNASEFVSRVSFPIFRDTDGSAWREMRPNAVKHDTYVFGPDGKRAFFFEGSTQGDPANWKKRVGDAVRTVAARN